MIMGQFGSNMDKRSEDIQPKVVKLNIMGQVESILPPITLAHIFLVCMQKNRQLLQVKNGITKIRSIIKMGIGI